MKVSDLLKGDRVQFDYTDLDSVRTTRIGTVDRNEVGVNAKVTIFDETRGDYRRFLVYRIENLQKI